MISLPQPPSINIQNPLGGISNSVNNLISSTSKNISNVLPDKRVSGLKFEKPAIDCAKYSLNSLKTLPIPSSIPIPQLGLPTVKDLTDRVAQFIPPIPSLPTLPNVPTVPNLPNTSNLPSLKVPALSQVPIPKVPTMDSINPLPIDIKVKAWLGEPPKIPNLTQLRANLPNIPKPPYFCPKCS